MKHLFLISILLFSQVAIGSPTEAYQDKIIYSATVSGKSFKVFFTTKPFKPAEHKISIAKVKEARDGDEGIEKIYNYPVIYGKQPIGTDGVMPKAENKTLHLSRLAVSFDGVIVEAPIELIACVFNPHPNTSFSVDFVSGGRVSISSDGKVATVELSVGDGGASSQVAFTFSSTGKVKQGLPDNTLP